MQNFDLGSVFSWWSRQQFFGAMAADDGEMLAVPDLGQQERLDKHSWGAGGKHGGELYRQPQSMENNEWYINTQ